MGHRSDSDSTRSSRANRKSKKRKRRRSYSGSSSSERSTKRRHRKRSSSRSRRRSRSSSRSSYDDHASRGSRRRSPSRKSHHKKSPLKGKKKNTDSVFGMNTGTLKDVFDVVPGFDKMTPAEQARIRVRRALKLAEESKIEMTEEQLYDKVIDKSKDADIKGQIVRSNQITVINNELSSDEDAEFKPTHFRSKANVQKLSKKQEVSEEFNKREDHHELAMFGHSSVDIKPIMLSRDEAMRKKEKEDEEALIKAKNHVDFMVRDPATLMSDSFKLTEQERERKWLFKLAKLREGLKKNLQTNLAVPV